MSVNKKYYWFKLKDDFFDSKEMRFIRCKPSGAEMIIVLLKLQLKGLNNGGIIETDGIFDTVEEELAFIINEEKDLVTMTLKILSKFNMVTKVNATDINMLLHDDLVGSETASTIRSRNSRAKDELLQCNTDATKCNTEIEIEIEKEIEKEKHIVQDEPLDERFELFWNMYNKKSGRKNCIAKWGKMKDCDKNRLIEVLPQYIKMKSDMKYRPLPLTFLNGELWNDEIIIDVTGKNGKPFTKKKVKTVKLDYRTGKYITEYI